MSLQNIIQIIIIGILFFMILNIAIEPFFNRLTEYKSKDKLHIQNTKFILYYMFFGVFMLIFYKKVREYKKQKYILNDIRFYEYIIKPHDDYSDKNNKQSKEYIKYMNNKRYLKLKKIQKKSKSFSNKINRLIYK